MWGAWEEEDCLPLSGIQHFAFCRRQFALIHIERQWVESTLTYEGRTMHERANDPFVSESRGTVLITRSVPLLSRVLGLYGVADVVEFRLCVDGGVPLEGREGLWRPFPVEYKRGRPKADDTDAVQLCAQAMCLEEMLNVRVPEGALFYGQTRRRQGIRLSQALRDHVTQLAREMHDMYDSGQTPPPVWTRACKRCSLRDICLPKVARNKDVERYVRRMIEDRTGGRLG